MSNTIISPEVFADAVNSKFSVKLRAANLATDYTDTVGEIMEYGSTVHFPVIDEINDAVVVTKGTPIVPNALSMTDAEAEIKQVGISQRLYDKDSVQVKGQLMEKMIEQLAYKMAKAVDTDLVNELKTYAVYTDDIDALTAAAIEGAFDVFGDDIDNDTFAGILISSKLRKNFMTMDAFIDSTKTNVAVENGIARGGLIGFWNGTIPVYVSDNGTYDSNKDEALLAIVKKDALGVAWQRIPTIEYERESKLYATDIVAGELYAVKLAQTSGASLLNVALNS